MLANSPSLFFVRTRALFLSLAHEEWSLPAKFIGWTSLLSNLVSLSLSLFLCLSLSLSHSLSRSLSLSFVVSLSLSITHTPSCLCP